MIELFVESKGGIGFNISLLFYYHYYLLLFYFDVCV